MSGVLIVVAIVIGGWAIVAFPLAVFLGTLLRGAARLTEAYERVEVPAASA
jgi:uncharacterized membrane protein